MNSRQNSSWVRAPQQARSQETFERFVSATRELLSERPFDEITVADIVMRAERTVGSFYARFDDKDAVLHEVVRQLDEQIKENVARFCEPERWEGRSLRDFITGAVESNVIIYRRRSLLFFASIHAAIRDERFRAERVDILRYSAEQMKGFILSRVDEVNRADPAHAADRMFEIMTRTLDHELLFGRFTTTSLDGDHDLSADLAEHCLWALGITDTADVKTADR